MEFTLFFAFLDTLLSANFAAESLDLYLLHVFDLTSRLHCTVLTRVGRQIRLQSQVLFGK